MKEYGFIGVGNMAGAMIGGILRSRKAEPSQIVGSCRSPKSRDKAQALYQIAMTGDNREVAKEAKIRSEDPLSLCQAAVSGRRDRGDQRGDQAGSADRQHCGGTERIVFSEGARKRDPSHPPDAQYAGIGRRRHDGSLRERECF